MLCAIDAEIGAVRAEEGRGRRLQRCEMPPLWCPAPARADSFSLSGTGGFDVSWMTSFTVPVTATASTAGSCAADDVESGIVETARTNTSRPRADRGLPEREVRAAHRSDSAPAQEAVLAGRHVNRAGKPRVDASPESSGGPQVGFRSTASGRSRLEPIQRLNGPSP
jgi:hypothetical protein